MAGSETDYATVFYSDGRADAALKLPVMYDYYMADGDVYSRIDGNGLARPVNGTSAFPLNLRGHEDLLCDAGTFADGDTTYSKYMLCYVPCKVGADGITEAEYIVGEHVVEHDGKTYKFQITEYGEGTDFIAVKPDAAGNYVIDYDAVYASLNASNTDYSDRFTGYSYYEPYAREYYFTEFNSKTEKQELKTVSGKNYFRNSENKMVQLDALTLSDIVVDPFTPLDSVPVTDVVADNGDVVYKVFGNTTLGSLLRGENLDEIFNDLEVSTFIDNVSPDNKLMCYISYKISHLQAVGDGTYTAIYDKDGAMEREVTVHVANGYITEVIDNTDGSVMDGVKVSEVAALANTMPITALMDIRADEAIMVYLGYGATGLKSAVGDGYAYTGKVEVNGVEKECFVATQMAGDIENVTAVWYMDGENKVYVGGTKVNEISDRVNNFAKKLTIGDVLKLDGTESEMLVAIKDTPLSQMETRINNLTVDEMFTETEINASSMLRQLRGTKLTDLHTAIDELLIQSIYAEEVYALPAGTGLMEVIAYDPALTYYTYEKKTDGTDGYEFKPVTGTIDYSAQSSTVYYTQVGAEWKVVFNEKLLYYSHVGDATELVLMDDTLTGPARDNAMGKLTEAQFEAGKYYTYGAAKGMWRLVLYRDNTEKAYTINNFNNMVNTCADNVYAATLYDLQAADIIDKNADLSKQFGIGVAKKELGTFTLQELIAAVIALST